jgi:chondroitin AC lyase
MSPEHNQQPILQEILGNYRQWLFRTHNPDSFDLVSLRAALDGSGRWPDIDYDDDKPGRWELMNHVNRLRALAFELATSDAGEISDDELERATLRALDDWLAHRYQASNWWYNEIGVPRLMRDVAVLLNERLDRERRELLLEVVAQHRVRGTGANLLWTAELAMHHGCLKGNRAAVRQAAERIRAEITVGSPEGIQEDWSFFQHSARLQMFHYGLSFLDVALPVGWQLRGTPWHYTASEITILTNLLLEGAQWMLRGPFTVPSTLDRSVTRPGTTRINLLPYLELWKEVDPENGPALEKFAGRLVGKEPPLDGFRHFARADFTVYHRPQFSFFLKTVSDRTFLTELMNNENLLGENLNTGDHYLLQNGAEYFNLMPVWDWEKLPGIVSAEGAGKIIRRPFTGGIGDAASGMAVMDTERQSTENMAALKVRRSWFFHGDSVVALCGGWEGLEEGTEPFLVLAQSRLEGEVFVFERSGRLRRLPEGVHEIESAAVIYHNRVAWFPLNAARVSIEIGPRQGSWSRINGNLGEEQVTESVFLATLYFSEKPGAGGFAMMPAAGPEEIAGLMSAPPWRILRNDRSVQAVEFPDEVAMIAFFAAETLTINGRKVSVSQPCLVFRRDATILAADPTAAGGPLEIQWHDKSGTIEMPPGGRPVTWPQAR